MNRHILLRNIPQHQFLSPFEMQYITENILIPTEQFNWQYHFGQAFSASISKMTETLQFLFANFWRSFLHILFFSRKTNENCIFLSISKNCDMSMASIAGGYRKSASIYVEQFTLNVAITKHLDSRQHVHKTKSYCCS